MKSRTIKNNSRPGIPLTRMIFHLVICSLALAGSVTGSMLEIPEQWEYSAPLVAPEPRTKDPSYSQKDPTVVFFEGRWHVFMTVKLPERSAIEYISFERWEEADSAPRHLLEVSESDYFCAPQVFYFEPHEKWYLVYQVGMEGSRFMWVAFSTTSDISDPDSWTQAYLFITSLNGKMWRLWTDLNTFPYGFRDFQLALEGPFYEASHTYRVQGKQQYLTLVEEGGVRHFKAYTADRLDGEWTPLADTFENPFAGKANIQAAPGVTPWTDNISHGELIRNGYNQKLEMYPSDWEFLFQGVWEHEKPKDDYGKIPWRLGLLKPVSTP